MDQRTNKTLLGVGWSQTSAHPTYNVVNSIHVLVNIFSIILLLNLQALRIQNSSLYPLFSFLPNIFIKWEISAADILSIPGCILLEEKSLQALETWLQIVCFPLQRRTAEKKQTLLAFLVNYTRHNLIYSSLLLRGNNCQINRKLFLQIAEGQFSGVTAAGLRVQRPWRRCRPPSSARPPISPPSPPATHPPSSSTHAVAPDRKFFLEKCPICTWTL